MEKANLLIDWIHRVEFDIKVQSPTKRRDSIIYEIYFQEKLSKNSSFNLPSEIVTGWMKRSGERKQWFKVRTNDTGSKIDINKRFIRLLSSQTDVPEIYSADYEIKYSSGRPLAAFRIRRLELINDSIHWRNDRYADWLTRDVNSRIVAELGKRGTISPGDDLKPWLSNLPVQRLEEIFATRCLMNYSNLYLTDIDGIAAGGTQSLLFIEFKRKEPASGKRYVLPHPAIPSNYLEMAKELNRAANSANSSNKQIASQGKKHLSELISVMENSWLIAQQHCFGLDTTHAETAIASSELGCVFRYIIWNKGPTPLDQLLDTHLSPLSSPHLLALDVRPSHFDGVSKANGDKSGTYSRGVQRHQVMIKFSDFQTLTYSGISSQFDIS